MNIEQINDNKIKVTVNQEDQKEFGVTYESMNYSDINTRKLCEKIMLIAKKQTGFSIGNAKLLVEARQSVNGNVTLYLSKIPVGSERREEYLCQTICFNSVNDMLDGCNLLLPYLEKLECSYLYEYDNKYYLYFEIFEVHADARLLLQNLLEYSERTQYDKYYLSEHGKIIAEGNAIEKILLKD